MRNKILKKEINRKENKKIISLTHVNRTTDKASKEWVIQ